MRESTLELIRCPNCGDEVLALYPAQSDAREVREGQVTCQGCDRMYPVRDGILSLLLPNETIEREQIGWVQLLDPSKNPEEWTDDFIVSLPRVDDPALGVKGDNLSQWVKQADNFDAVLNRLTPAPGQTVLDIGAGRCWSTAAFARRGCRCVAFDILPDKYLGLRSSEIFFERENIYFDRVMGDMAAMPFQNDAFDIVFTNCSLHHTSALGDAFREMARVVKPGGVVAVANEPVKGVFRNTEASHEEIDAGINEHVFTIGEWLRAAQNAGLQGQVLFPGSVRAVLESRRPVRGVKGVLVRAARGLWKVPGVRRFTESVLRWPLHILFGLGFNFIGTKLQASPLAPLSHAR